MRRVFLVALNEFVKYITRRGYIISLFMLPIWVFIAAVVPKWVAQSTPTRVFAIVDRAGGYAQAISEAVRADDDARTLSALSDYAHANLDMKALRTAHPEIAEMLDASDGDNTALAAFHAMGGEPAMRGTLKQFRNPGVPPFEAPRPRFIVVPGGDAFAHMRPAEFAAFAEARLENGALYALVVIPQGFSDAPNAPAVEYWSTSANDLDFQGFIRTTLNNALRDRVLARAAPGLPPSALQPSAKLKLFDPGAGADHRQSTVDEMKSYMPAAFSLLLMLTVFMNAGALLTGVLEEKSSRIVEVILSCVTPGEFMTGKLLGAAGAALLTLLIWGGMFFGGAALLIPGAASGVSVMLMSVLTSNLLPMMLLCFVCGFLIYASFFLGVGSLATSINDAQALLGPTLILVMGPMVLTSAMLRGPNGTLATVMSLIPIYTPFFLMFRLPWHPPLIQAVGATVLMVAMAIFMVIQMGRVFARHVLATDQPPRLLTMLRVFRKKKPA
ncbi:MAG TPA: ABC transporter permease [Rhizomicrobium sp.]|nr:ABC transporter permease [Rhizomicrobium sp.]